MAKDEKKKELPPYLDTVENQYEKAQQREVGKRFEIGEMVKVYLVSGVQRMKVNDIYDTPVEHVKLYELKTADGSYYYVTKYFIEKVKP